MTEAETMEAWLDKAVEVGASDLHIVAGHKPTLRLHGELSEISADICTAEFVKAGLTRLCDPEKFELFERDRNIDFALQRMHKNERRRFRANYFVTGPSIGACFRVIPEQIPEFEWSGFPWDVAERLAHFRNGLVLITGVTGAGKTTTLAMIINMLNREGGYRIITAEDPIEYVFPKHPNSIVTQREVGQDIQSFADGLKYGLRQDPDVILVGEIRDQETAQMALSAAETGHLVFSTLHTRDAKGAVSRFTDLFRPATQPEVRAQLAMALRAVVSQHLLPGTSAGKRQLALEIMINNNPIASAIRMGKLESIDTGIVTGRADGMVSLDESLRRLAQSGAITRETAERFVTDATILSRPDRRR